MQLNNTSTRIYQLYFKPEQVEYLNPLFTAYDNTVNLNPNDREYPLIRNCHALAKADNIELWGTVSWNYKFKFSSGALISNEYFLDHIRNNPGYDVYFFNPFTNHVPIVYNVWEQGQWCHPHIISIMETVFPMIGLDAALLRKPQTRESIFWGSMCVANEKFWHGYFELAERYVAAINKLPPYIKHLHTSPAAYRDTTINYFAFIQERLMSTYVATQLNTLKILPFHVNEHILEPELVELNTLKSQAIAENSRDKFELWIMMRNTIKPRLYPQDNIDWATEWLSVSH